MSEKLDALYSQYKENKAAVEKQEEENASLEVRLAGKQDIVLETMKKDLRGFLTYLKDVDFRRRFYLEDIKIDFYSSSYGHTPCLIVDFGRGDNIQLKSNPSGYSSNPVIFDLNEDSWDWYSGKSKTFIAENWGKISSALENEICKAFNKAIEGDMQKINEVQTRLLSSIDKVTENIDISKRKDVLLYNAISLFMDETWDQYDDKQEWFEMLQNELGTSVDELEELGIKITDDGGIERVDKHLQKEVEEKRYYVNEDYPAETWENILGLTTETARKILDDNEFTKWYEERNARFPGSYLPLDYWLGKDGETKVQILFSGVGTKAALHAVEDNFKDESLFDDFTYREFEESLFYNIQNNSVGDFKLLWVGYIDNKLLTDDLSNSLIRLTHHAECLYEDTGAEYVHVEVCVDGKWYGRDEKDMSVDGLISCASQRSMEQKNNAGKAEVEKDFE